MKSDVTPQGKRGSPLSGCRILDLADEKGMSCSRLLAGLGAEVIRVEKPGEAMGRDTFSWAANVGKLDITLNLETGRGREIFRQLSRTADVLVESYQPGYLKELGLGYSELEKINPGLVMASITGFGQSGLYRDYHSGDMVASAMGGQMYVCGEPELLPLKPYGNPAYDTAALFAAIGVMLALRQRQATGKGQWLDISLQECVAASLDHVLVRYFYEGVVAGREGSRHWNNAFRTFPCRDGYILLSLMQQWETLVEWVDAESMAGDLTDAKWLNAETRAEHIEHIIEVLERWTGTHTVAELVEKGQLMRFPWAEVTSIPQLLDSPQLRERGFFVELESSDVAGKYKFPGAPCKLSQTPWRVADRLPHTGEHNARIYQGELGLTAEEMEALIKEGVI